VELARRVEANPGDAEARGWLRLVHRRGQAPEPDWWSEGLLRFRRSEPYLFELLPVAHCAQVTRTGEFQEPATGSPERWGLL
jgi:hypothetical protein